MSQNRNKLTQHISQTQVYQGLIPPPDMMVGFKQLGDDFPERILCIAEKTSNARNEKMLLDSNNTTKLINNQLVVIKTEYKFKMIGLIATFMIALLMISLAFLFIKNGNSTEGMASLIIAFGTILPSIIKGITAK